MAPQFLALQVKNLTVQIKRDLATKVVNDPHGDLQALPRNLRLQRLLIGKVDRKLFLGIFQVVVTHFRDSEVVEEIETNPGTDFAVGPNPRAIYGTVLLSPVSFGRVLEDEGLIELRVVDKFP